MTTMSMVTVECEQWRWRIGYRVLVRATDGESWRKPWCRRRPGGCRFCGCRGRDCRAAGWAREEEAGRLEVLRKVPVFHALLLPEAARALSEEKGGAGEVGAGKDVG